MKVNNCISYEERFQNHEHVNSYETHEYRANSYASCIWQIQQSVLQDILTSFRLRANRPVKLLDFACGTGRITKFVEKFADVVVGIDISPEMVEVARTKGIKAEFIVGDILSGCKLMHLPYDVITSFRFLLNADVDIRKRVLLQLRQVIMESDGLLIVNVHGNSRSIRHPVIVWKRWCQDKGKTRNKQDVMLNEMSPSEAKHLLAETGFEVVEQIGFGIMPSVLYRTPLRRTALAIDRFAATRGWLKSWSIDLMFVCRPSIQERGDVV